MASEAECGGSQFRVLSAEEVGRLTEQGCSCDNWAKIRVLEDFDAAAVRLTHFSGCVELGVFEKQISLPSGLARPAGIYNATIHNCTVGNNVYISGVANRIANYVIEDEVVIENVGLLAVEGRSSFGNGDEVAVVNENAGREISIYDDLSAQIVYVIVFYRHHSKVIEKLLKMIEGYAESVTSESRLIGKGARITNSQLVRNVRIGAAVRIGYGIDGDEQIRDADFDAVRGTFEEDACVCGKKNRQQAKQRSPKHSSVEFRSFS